MIADAYAATWTDLRPRPSADTNRHLRYMVGGFARRFAGREFDSIERHEALGWGMENLSAVRYVRTMISDAIKDGAATRNVLADIAFPKPPKRRREEHVPTVDQVQLLLDHADAQLACAIGLGAYVGLRAGEMLGAGYLGLSLAMDDYYVHRQLLRNGRLGPIKGKVKERRVVIFRPARPYIEEWANHPESATAYLLADLQRDGEEPWPHSGLRQGWEALRDRLELRCEFHQLRTFCAVWLLEQGASPIDVAIQLHGHTDPSVVLGYYAMIDKSKGLARLRRVVDGE